MQLNAMLSSHTLHCIVNLVLLGPVLEVDVPASSSLISLSFPPIKILIIVLLELVMAFLEILKLQE